MHPQTAAAFKPGQSLLGTVTKQSAQNLGETIASTQGAFDQAVADIPTNLQAQGIDFEGFSQPEYNRYFGVGALPALAQLEQAGQEAAMQRRGLLAQLGFQRGTAGLEFGDRRTERRIEDKQQRRQFALERRITKADIAAELEARRIERARAEAEAARQAAAYSSYGGSSSGGSGDDQPQQTEAPSAFDQMLVGLSNKAGGGDTKAAQALAQIKVDPFWKQNKGRYVKLYSQFAK